MHFNTTHFNAKIVEGSRSSIHPLYNTWSGMIQRCENANNTKYAKYGARGIKVCERWRNSFELFVADVGPRPSQRHTLDRINNMEGYEPNNCQWSLPVDQSRNTRRNIIIEANGQSMCVAAWSEKTGIPAYVLYQRIGKLGWSGERTINTPVRNLKITK